MAVAGTVLDQAQRSTKALERCMRCRCISGYASHSVSKWMFEGIIGLTYIYQVLLLCVIYEGVGLLGPLTILQETQEFIPIMHRISSLLWDLQEHQSDRSSLKSLKYRSRRTSCPRSVSAELQSRRPRRTALSPICTLNWSKQSSHSALNGTGPADGMSRPPRTFILIALVSCAQLNSHFSRIV